MPGDKTNSQKHQKEIRQIHLQYSCARHLLLSCGLYMNLSSTLWNEGNHRSFHSKLSTGHFLLVLGNNNKMEHGISRVNFILGVTLVDKESRHNPLCQTTQLFRGKCICQACEKIKTARQRSTSSLFARKIKDLPATFVLKPHRHGWTQSPQVPNKTSFIPSPTGIRGDCQALSQLII